jgi:hypothetical protein
MGFLLSGLKTCNYVGYLFDLCCFVFVSVYIFISYFKICTILIFVVFYKCSEDKFLLFRSTTRPYTSGTQIRILETILIVNILNNTSFSACVCTYTQVEPKVNVQLSEVGYRLGWKSQSR